MLKVNQQTYVTLAIVCAALIIVMIGAEVYIDTTGHIDTNLQDYIRTLLGLFSGILIGLGVSNSSPK